ncbi:hypothetical protein U4T58_20745, partial [Escherichia coli]|nr:hypothetical protein [Escherichia coli]
MVYNKVPFYWVALLGCGYGLTSHEHSQKKENARMSNATATKSRQWVNENSVAEFIPYSVHLD